MKDNIRIEPKWDKTKEEIWNDHFEKMTASDPERAISASRVAFTRRGFYYAAVAAVILLLLVPLAYTRNIVAKRGEHVTYELPDGSVASLNALSEITYKPLLWLFNRHVKMDGEVHFSVEKGSKFTVKSNNGSVTVLGTKFNVKSRDGIFEVSCMTGKVSVISPLDNTTKEKVIIEGGEGVSFSSNEKMERISGKTNEEKTSWMEYRFVFTEAPLNQVLEEISRQYNIDIAYNSTEGYLYTGKFSKDLPVEKVLEIVTLPFSLKIVKGESGYKIIK
ncbi:MAG: FecR domain-containing protein [Bacteroidales bacterium]|nr:FecR domain-containing protein [Bacteroidales bacterium]